MADQRLELLKLQADVAKQNAEAARTTAPQMSLTGQLALQGANNLNPQTGFEALAKGLLMGVGVAENKKAETSRQQQIQQYLAQSEAYAQQLNTYAAQVTRQHELTQAVAPYARTVTQVMADAKAGLIAPQDAEQKLNSLYTDIMRSKGVSGRVSLLQDLSGFAVEGTDAMTGQPINSTVSYGDLLAALPEEIRQPLADQAYATIRGQAKLAEAEALAGRPLSDQEKAIKAGIAEAPRTNININEQPAPVTTAFDARIGMQRAPRKLTEPQLKAEEDGLKRTFAELDTQEQAARQAATVADEALSLLAKPESEPLTGSLTETRAVMTRLATAAGMKPEFIEKIGGFSDKDLGNRAKVQNLLGDIWLNATQQIKGALTEQEGERLARFNPNADRTPAENADMLSLIKLASDRKVERTNFVRNYTALYNGYDSGRGPAQANEAFDLYLQDLGRAQAAGAELPNVADYLQQDFLLNRLSTADEMRARKRQELLSAPNLSGAQPSGGGNPAVSKGQVPSAPAIKFLGFE